MWRRYAPLAIVLGVQLLILVLVPSRVILARLVGRDVTLRTAPVDPYDVLSGYYVTLAYEVESRTDALPPGLEPGERIWIVVERSEDDPAWRLVRYARTPEGVDERDRVALPGRVRYGRVRLDGAGRFYIPEARRREVEAALRAVRRRALVDLRVGPDGTLALLRLRAGDRTFGME